MKKTSTIFSFIIILHFAAIANKNYPNPNQRFVEMNNTMQHPIENPDADTYLFNDNQSLDHFSTPNDLLPNSTYSQNLKSNIIFTHRLDSIIQYVNQDFDNPDVKTYYEYYPTGDSLRITELHSRLRWDNSWSNDYFETLYDANGNRLERIEISETFSYKINQSFDDNNRLIEWSRFRRDSADESWRGTGRYINTFNESGNLINRLGYSWSNETADWIYSYNQKFEWVEINGRILNSIYLRENWNIESNEFQNSELQSRSYNEDGVFISYLREYWDVESASWKNNHKQDFTINAAGLRILSLLYDWDSTNQIWLANSRIEREYDNLGKETKYLYQLYDMETDTFVNSELFESQFNDMGNRIHYRAFIWDLGLEIWKGEMRLDDEFVNGNRVNQFRFTWDETNQDWMNSWMWEYIYDDVYADKSSVIQTNYYSWNSEASGWTISSEESNTYRQDILPENLLSNDIYSEITLFIKRHKVIGEIARNNFNPGGAFSQTVYYYTTLENSTSVEKIENYEYKVFPNPASEQLTIAGLQTIGNIEIYVIKGKLLLSQKVSENEIVEISSLSPGLYIYRVFEDQANIKTGKLIKY